MCVCSLHDTHIYNSRHVLHICIKYTHVQLKKKERAAAKCPYQVLSCCQSFRGLGGEGSLLAGACAPNSDSRLDPATPGTWSVQTQEVLSVFFLLITKIPC